MTVDAAALRSGERRALAKAITLIESSRDDHQQQAQTLLESVLPATGNSIRVGITGIPGVGKSTFIEALGLYLVGQGKKVAVLAVDPSSPISGGSILGDKTRMELLSREPNAFIRPSPSECSLGGVAHKTRETMLLCEAAGYDVILVETVGVGQSEYQVAGMVDFFLVLMLPNAGDELQGIKKGIMELADALVVNKADGDSEKLADRTRNHYQSAVNLLHYTAFWTPRVLTCSARDNRNIDAVWNMVNEHHIEAVKTGYLPEKRARQNIQWMQQLLQEMIELRLKQNPRIRDLLPSLERQVTHEQMTPYGAARKVMELF